MDLSAILARAKADIVHSANEPSTPDSTSQTIPETGLKANPNFTTHPIEEVEASLETEAEVNFEAILNTTEYIESKTEQQTDSKCYHLCDCGDFWSHGEKQKCRYPDVLKQGKCPKCLDSGDTSKLTYTIEDDFKENDKGDRKLSPRAQVIIRNEESKRIKDMSIEQLTYHMNFLAFKIEELRVAALQTRHKRTELEEEQVAELPESERAAFIEALRAGKPKKVKTPKEPKQTKTSKKEAAENALSDLVKTIVAQGVRPLPEAKVIAQMMQQTGKSQAIVEAMLYD